MITKSDNIFIDNIKTIMTTGVWSENARPRYASGNVANSKYITGVFAKYDLSRGELPITTLRPIPIKSAIKELLWIYQDQTSELSVLEKKYGVNYWSEWEVNETNTIGQRYGATVRKYDIMNRILKGLKDNPWNRRNVINLWQYEDFDETDGLLPCAFMVMFDVRKVDNVMYLDATLTQRSNDMLVAHHINAMQYVALQMMIAKHFGWQVGEFNYFIQNLHIYDNQFDNAKTLLERGTYLADTIGAEFVSNITPAPKFILDVPDGTNFYDIKHTDFKLVGYNPIKPQLKFDLAI